MNRFSLSLMVAVVIFSTGNLAAQDKNSCQTVFGCGMPIPNFASCNRSSDGHSVSYCLDGKLHVCTDDLQVGSCHCVVSGSCGDHVNPLENAREECFLDVQDSFESCLFQPPPITRRECNQRVLSCIESVCEQYAECVDELFPDSGPRPDLFHHINKTRCEGEFFTPNGRMPLENYDDYCRRLPWRIPPTLSPDVINRPLANDSDASSSESSPGLRINFDAPER